MPVITIKNTANTSTLYTYSSFTGTSTGITTVFPLYCSVSLSQNTHGEFTIQFEDQAKVMESTITVGSRVIIECGKQSSQLTRLISGIVRKKGYSRGANTKVNYTISGSSTGIRLNELITYVVSQSTKLGDGITPDITDATRKADTLLASVLGFLTTDGILSISNLAANSDVETFIANLSIEFGELQDAVNYIESQSGGQVVVDTTDLVNFRHEIKNTFFGRGFTIKNRNTGASTDDADDTMYLRGKNWNYEDDFYKSANYANRVYGILQPEPRPSGAEDLGFTVLSSAGQVTQTNEIALKFRSQHSRFLAGDIYLVGAQWANAADILPTPITCRICKDSGGLPQNVGGVVSNIVFMPDQFQDPLPQAANQENYILINDQFFVSVGASSTPNEIFLDTTKDYWIIITPSNFSANHRFVLGKDSRITNATVNRASHAANFSTTTAGGSGWGFLTSMACLGVGRYRAQSFVMHDPKAVQAVQSGLTAGLYTDMPLPEAAVQIKTNQSMYRHLAGQLYEVARPRTMYNFPRVMAPNIPPVPGDPIVISDSVLGFSASAGNPVVLTTCGDMTYSWGNMDSGGYEAPTNLNISCIGIHPRYK